MKVSALLATTAGATLALAANPTIQKGTRTGRGVSADSVPHFGRRQLADSASCTRGLPFLQQLGVNVIHRRLDAQRSTTTLALPHCIAALSGARIYIILDLALPLNGSIDTTKPTWSTNLQDEYMKIIDVFSKYDNVLTYNVGNEVLTSSATNAVPFIKAAARNYLARSHLTLLVLSRCRPTSPHLFFAFADMYIDISSPLSTSISSSAFVGYADIDGTSDIGDVMADYLSCVPSSAIAGSEQ
ncbi:Glucanosyltransferase-domain-containing protein [Mycena galopus ATCC 62051]|nr:Glucanosyltransferase-domain-containing protein [Mycena galopus ATCC 62051]